MTLSVVQRKALTERIWASVPSELESYGSLIDQLLAALTDEQLELFATDYCDDEDDDPECSMCYAQTPESDLRPGTDGERLCIECYRLWEKAVAADA